MSESLPTRIGREVADRYLDDQYLMSADLRGDLARLIAAGIRDALDEAAKVAWEYARGLRHHEPGVGSERVADHIAAAIEALKG